MAFEFKLLTDEIREKMFDFIKPVYKATVDFEVGYINWIYGVYDSKREFFITYVSSKSDNEKYVLIFGNDNVFYISVNRYKHTFSEIPDELVQYGDIIQGGIKLYKDGELKKRFLSSFSDEEEKCLNEIKEIMQDKCRPAIEINSYEDAEKLFYQDEFNYHYIRRMYNKKTVENFNKYMSDEKMRTIRGEKYRNIISKIFTYGSTLNEEEYKQISMDFQKASRLNTWGMDNIYVEMTFEVIKKAYLCAVNSFGYIHFIEEYIRNCIKVFPNKIESLRPILDFMNKYLNGKSFGSLELYRKELEKRIYNRVEGFQFVLTTDEIRDKMFDFLKPQYKSIHDLDVTNINWITGVYDKKSGIFLTQIFELPDGIARCGVNFYGYIVITDSGNVFRVDNDYEFERKTHNFKIPKQYDILAENIKEGIDFYRYDLKYISILNEEIVKELEEIKNIMDDRCHRNFLINCEDDARNLFMLANCHVNTIIETYNKKTINDFKKYITDDKLILWRGDKYLQLLEEISSGSATEQDCRRKFYSACLHFSCGVSDTYDKQFLNAVQYMYNSCIMRIIDEHTLKNYINRYTREYPDKVKNIVPLIEFVDICTKDKDLKETIENVKKLLGIGWTN
ncbi:MAG: hypothetical protein IJA32_17185 [Lachnospiraceae bacterium]|nr:hypothetical protein [Lachnospiraceae bacterium]